MPMKLAYDSFLIFMVYMSCTKSKLRSHEMINSYLFEIHSLFCKYMLTLNAVSY